MREDVTPCMAEVGISEQRVEARRILGDVAKQLDRKLSVEVRDVPGQDRLQVTLTHGSHHHQVEMKMDEILAANDDTVARHGLKLRIKRVVDAMLFRKMPDHRIAVKSIAPPGGSFGRGRGPFGGGGAGGPRR